MGFKNYLATIVSQQANLTSILSAEAVKTSQTAYWITQIPLSQILNQPVKQIIQEIVSVQRAIGCEIGSAADMEVAIAAKVNAVTGNKSSICWKRGCDCCCPPVCEVSCAPTGNLIVNGDFETGNFSGWSATNATVVASGGAVASFSGTYVAQLTTATTGRISQNVLITGGCPLQITFATAAQTVNPTLTANLRYFQGTLALAPIVTKTIAYDNPNTFYTFVYLDTPPSNADNLTVEFVRDTASGNVWIDNVTLEVP
jgi:hypothetical protein